MKDQANPAAAGHLEARIRAKGDEALSLAMAGRMTEARASYAELANQVAAIAQANTTEGRGA